MKKYKKAKLILEDKTLFVGYTFGYEESTNGEVVFNTGMVGYYEALTDPSYKGQILTLTYPLIGNYGVPCESKEVKLSKYFESDQIQVQGLIISDYSENYSYWNVVKSLGRWLKDNQIPAIFGIDTRALTQKLRSSGTMMGKIVIEKNINLNKNYNRNFVKEVSVSKPITYKAGKKKVVLIDCGVKTSIIKSFLKRNITVIRVPWDYDYTKIAFDGLLISNGPGDPKICKKTILYVNKMFSKNKPIFGICLGNQILGLAAGANTYKLKFGHRSQNQPCQEIGTQKCYITSQNHGYAIDSKILPRDWKEWFKNANDGTNEGIKHKIKPFFSVQFHPEAMPGPTDTDFLFDSFISLL